MVDVVAAPPVQPPRYGLIVAAPVVEEAEARWQNGYTFRPGACEAGGRLSLDDCDRVGQLVEGSQPDTVDGEPFLVYAAETCSAFGFGAAEYAARARENLLAVQSFELAEELWAGSLGLPQRSLNDAASDTVTSGAADPVAALACLEAGLASCYRGRRGMIHVTPQVLTHLLAANAVRVEGNLVLTALGTIVVADAGYDGSGPGGTPAGASQWGYATGIVQVLLDPVEVRPPDLDSPETRQVAVDRRTNTISVWAQRLVTWKLDECCHLGAEFDLAVCAVGGAS